MTESFKHKVYKVVAEIPHGKVMTYGQIAAFCGKPRGARLVGQIAHYGSTHLHTNLDCFRAELETLPNFSDNHFVEASGASSSYSQYGSLRSSASPRASTECAKCGGVEIPWHRVVNKTGGMASGYWGGKSQHQKHLEAEGVKIKNYQIVEMEKYLYQLTINKEQGTNKRKTVPLIVILGPTASGKTAMAVELAKKFNGEMICADSRTVYKGLDVGTAKPTDKEMAGIEHHLINVVEPNQTFTAGQFKKLALTAIDDISNRGKLAIMVGGTGLYIDSVIFDFQFGKKTNSKLRDKLNKLSTSQLAKLVKQAGGEELVDIKNPRRMIRFLETGKVSSGDSHLRPNTLIIGIQPDPAILKHRITKRSDEMFESGVVDEAKKIVKKYGWDNEAMRGVIYKLIKKYLANAISLEEVKQQVVIKDSQYAKRQLTWFKRNPHINWVQSTQQAEKLIKSFIID